MSVERGLAGNHLASNGTRIGLIVVTGRETRKADKRGKRTSFSATGRVGESNAARISRIKVQMLLVRHGVADEKAA